MASDKTPAEVLQEFRADIMKEITGMIGNKPFIQNSQGQVMLKTRWIRKDHSIICPACGSEAEKTADKKFGCTGCGSVIEISQADVPNLVEKKR